MCFFQWKTWKSANFFSVLPVNGRTWLFFALSPLRDQWKSQEGPNVTKFSTTFARDLNTMHEESNCQRPLSNQSCGVHLIAELLWRGEVMQGVRRRERVVMVEICMVVEGLVLGPDWCDRWEAGFIAGEARGSLSGGKNLHSLDRSGKDLPMASSCEALSSICRVLLNSRCIKCTLMWLYKCYWTWARKKNGLDQCPMGIDNYHDKGAWMSWDIEPNRPGVVFYLSTHKMY